MNRFLLWLLPIIVLLVCIPLLLIYNVTLFAKIAGIVVVVLTTLAIRYWMFRSGVQRVHSERVKLTINERFFLDNALPYYKRMSSSEKKVFEERAGLLLAAISFDNFDHSEVSKEDCLAAASIISLINDDLRIESWKNVIVVFRGESGIETQIQGGSRVIFLSLEVISDALENYSPSRGQGVLPAEYAETLSK